MRTIRRVSYVDKLVLDFVGNVYSGAIVLGDVDNDDNGDVELAVGSLDGDLAVFKFGLRSPWKTCHDLGSITCLVVGDVRNKGRNSLLVITAEGLCHVFDVQDADVGEERPSFTQHLPPNINSVCISDVDGDGRNELVVATNNHYVHVYGLQHRSGDAGEALALKASWKLAVQPRSLAIGRWSDGTPYLMVGVNGNGYIVIDREGAIHEYKTSADGKSVSEADDDGAEPWLSLDTATLVVGDIGGHDDDDDDDDGAGASGAGGAVCKDDSSPDAPSTPPESPRIPPPLDTPPPLPLDAPPLDTPPPLPMRVHAPPLDTPESAPRAVRRPRGPRRQLSHRRYVMATMDGHVRLCRREAVLWDVRLDLMPFTVCKVDLCGDDVEEVVVCGWDGTTAILDQSRNVVYFDYQQRVSAFCAGEFSTHPNVKVSCLVYVPFTDEIHVYFNIRLESIALTSLSDALPDVRQYVAESSRQNMTRHRSHLEAARFSRALLYNTFDPRAFKARKSDLENELYRLSSSR